MGHDYMKVRRRNIRAATNTLLLIISVYLISNLLSLFLSVSVFIQPGKESGLEGVIVPVHRPPATQLPERVSPQFGLCLAADGHWQRPPIPRTLLLQWGSARTVPSAVLCP